MHEMMVGLMMVGILAMIVGAFITGYALRWMQRSIDELSRGFRSATNGGRVKLNKNRREEVKKR